MKSDRLKSDRDATLATMAPGLANALPFVRRVFGIMKKDHQVRVGLTSDTSKPDYIIDEFMGEPADPMDPDDHGQPVPIMALSGRTHRSLSYERWGDSNNWSSVGMTWHDVQDLLADIQGRPRRLR